MSLSSCQQTIFRGSFKQSSESLYPSTSIGQTIPSNQGYEDEFALQREISVNNSDEPNEVIVVDLQMPFFPSSSWWWNGLWLRFPPSSFWLRFLVSWRVSWGEWWAAWCVRFKASLLFLSICKTWQNLTGVGSSLSRQDDYEISHNTRNGNR